MIALSAPPVLAKVNTLQTDLTALDAVADSIETKVNTLDTVADAIDDTVNGGAGLQAVVPINYDHSIQRDFDNLVDYRTTDFLGWTVSNVTKIDGFATAGNQVPGFAAVSYQGSINGYAYFQLPTMVRLGALTGNTLVDDNGGDTYNTISVSFYMGCRNHSWNNGDSHSSFIGLADNTAVFGSNVLTTTTGICGLLHVGTSGYYRHAGTSAWGVGMAALPRYTSAFFEIRYKHDGLNVVATILRNGVSVMSQSSDIAQNYAQFKYFGFGTGTGFNGHEIHASNIFVKHMNT
jgi:hypothetical protein